MIPTIVSSLIYIKARRLMDLFPPKLRTVWKDWELRVLVLLSLTLQTILIILGNRRKYTSRIWIRTVLWFAYLTADWVATVALGVILNNLGNVMESIGKDGSLSESIQLTAFWAPFLLIHLGGPDNITAYALEDNELWLRHLLGLGVQTGIALYIFLVAWTGSHLSVLSILIFCAGIIKYGERTWVLRSASHEQLRESMPIPPKPDPNYSKYMRKYALKNSEGFHMKLSHVIEAQGVHIPVVENNSIPDAIELVKAYDLFQIFKRLLVDLILSFDDREKSQHLFEEISMESAFKVVEMELGLMHDMLYTKTTIIHSFIGCGMRILSFSFTVISLAVFSVINVHKHSNIDLILTFLLLSVAILLEIYSCLLLLSSDTTDIWLSRCATTSVPRAIIHKAITCLQLPKQPRWSNSMSQFNLRSFSLKDKPTVFYGIMKCLHFDKVLEKNWYTTHKIVPFDLKILIFNHLQKSFEHPEEESDYASNIKTLCSFRAGQVLKEHDELIWSVEVEFDQSILLWHIATDICSQSDVDPIQIYPTTFMPLIESSMLVSQYMLYLLVMYPSMLPMGIGTIRFQDTCAEITHFFEAHKPTKDKSDSDKFLNTYSWDMGCILTGKSTLDKSLAWKELFDMIAQVPPSEVDRERSKSVLFDACRLASKLQDISDMEQKWEMISNVWLEMLAYAACHCRGNHHAQQLRRGGELLTHVWLLMAHFGINEQFQIPKGARAKLVAK